MITERGFWIGADDQHVFDESLCKAIVLEFTNKFNDVVDIGCGNGSYTRYLNEQGFHCTGYDGNPETPRMSGELCHVLDFSMPQSIGIHELVISLEVGEHLPVEFEQIFIDNICNSSSKGILLSWAVEGQGGYGHFNCRNNDYIIEEMKKRGFLFNDTVSKKFRKASTFYWFPNTIMYFEKHMP